MLPSRSRFSIKIRRAHWSHAYPRFVEIFHGNKLYGPIGWQKLSARSWFENLKSREQRSKTRLYWKLFTHGTLNFFTCLAPGKPCDVSRVADKLNVWWVQRILKITGRDVRGWRRREKVVDEWQRFKFYGRLSNSLTHNWKHAYQACYQMFSTLWNIFEETDIHRIFKSFSFIVVSSHFDYPFLWCPYLRPWPPLRSS